MTIDPNIEIQIVHSRDPDSECAIEVFLGGKRVPYAQVTIEDIDPGRGYDEEYAAERREEAAKVADGPNATEFDIAVAEGLGAARFERFAL